MRKKEVYNNKSNALIQARHLCWSMPVKSLISIAVVKVPRNCWEKTLNIVVIKNGLYFNSHHSDGSFSHPVVLSYVVSERKIKIKTSNTMAPSYYSNVTSTQTSKQGSLAKVGKFSFAGKSFDSIVIRAKSLDNVWTGSTCFQVWSINKNGKDGKYGVKVHNGKYST